MKDKIVIPKDRFKKNQKLKEEIIEFLKRDDKILEISWEMARGIRNKFQPIDSFEQFEPIPEQSISIQIKRFNGKVVVSDL